MDVVSNPWERSVYNFVVRFSGSRRLAKQVRRELTGRGLDDLEAILVGVRSWLDDRWDADSQVPRESSSVRRHGAAFKPSFGPCLRSLLQSHPLLPCFRFEERFESLPDPLKGLFELLFVEGFSSAQAARILAVDKVDLCEFVDRVLDSIEAQDEVSIREDLSRDRRVISFSDDRLVSYARSRPKVRIAPRGLDAVCAKSNPASLGSGPSIDFSWRPLRIPLLACAMTIFVSLTINGFVLNDSGRGQQVGGMVVAGDGSTATGTYTDASGRTAPLTTGQVLSSRSGPLTLNFAGCRLVLAVDGLVAVRGTECELLLGQLDVTVGSQAPPSRIKVGRSIISSSVASFQVQVVPQGSSRLHVGDGNVLLVESSGHRSIGAGESVTLSG